MAINKKDTASIEDNLHLEEVQRRINESAKEIHRINNALGLGLVKIKFNGVYRKFEDGQEILIKSGNFRRKKLANLRVKVR